MDLKHHLVRQMAFSHATFGPGRRTTGVIDHIRKELAEVEKAAKADPGPGYRPDVIAEWTDVVILALDGLTRELAFADEKYLNQRTLYPESAASIACCRIKDKQDLNETRTWPDWRTQSEDKAIEHDRRLDNV